MIPEAIASVTSGQDLPEETMMSVMEEISEGRATPAQISALIVGLLMKGETVDEIAGAARVLRGKSLRIPVRPAGGPLVDVVGTGGDCTGTFNVSTTTAFVAAGCGVTVAKHGNRSVSSSCGSADVLEALGVNLELDPAGAAECLERVGIAFLFAPLLHPAMRHAGPPRREIKIKSIFNLVGPLTNPAGAPIEVLGVYRRDLTETMGRVLQKLGCESAYVVHGEDGCDEISISGPTIMTRLHKGQLTTGLLKPEDLGLARSPLDSVRGGDAQVNAAISRDVLEGRPGPCRDMVLMNAAAVLVAAGQVENLRDGVAVAAESIDSGRAAQKLEDMAAVSRELGARRAAVGA